MERVEYLSGSRKVKIPNKLEFPGIKGSPIREPAIQEYFCEFGKFSRDQRAWFLRRDTDPNTRYARCQFEGFNSQHEWVQCPIDSSIVGTKGLHAHHIIPAGWFREHLLGLSDIPEEWTENYPENGIILCGKYHHNGPQGVHPDYAEALKNYRNDRRGFGKVAENHTHLTKLGIYYWNTKYDKILTEIAERNTKRYKEKNPEDLWPVNPTRRSNHRF